MEQTVIFEKQGHMSQKGGEKWVVVNIQSQIAVCDDNSSEYEKLQVERCLAKGPLFCSISLDRSPKTESVLGDLSK